MRFAVLHHQFPPGHARQSHWDLLLEAGEAAWTWAVDQWPPPANQPAERLPDHRLLYLEYAGPISGDRGWVDQVASGTLEWLEQSPALVRCRLITADWTAELQLELQANQRWSLSFKLA